MRTNSHRHPLADRDRRDHIDARIRELRRRNVTYRDISHALDVFEDLAMTTKQVRYRCVKLGLVVQEPPS